MSESFDDIDDVTAALERLADLLADSESIPVGQTPAVERLNEIIDGLEKIRRKEPRP